MSASASSSRVRFASCAAGLPSSTYICAPGKSRGRATAADGSSISIRRSTGPWPPIGQYETDSISRRFANLLSASTLDLPHPLAGEAELPADLLERLRLVSRQARSGARVPRARALPGFGAQRRALRCGGRARPPPPVAGRRRRRSPREPRHPGLPTGWSRLVAARAAAFTSRACWSGRLASSAISSSDGSRPSCVHRWRSARFIFWSRSTI